MPFLSTWWCFSPSAFVSNVLKGMHWMRLPYTVDRIIRDSIIVFQYVQNFMSNGNPGSPINLWTSTSMFGVVSVPSKTFCLECLSTSLKLWIMDFNPWRYFLFTSLILIFFIEEFTFAFKIFYVGHFVDLEFSINGFIY